MSSMEAADARYPEADDQLGISDRGPGIKLPRRPKARAGHTRSWAGRLQTVAGVLLVLTGIGGLAYPMLATVLGGLGNGARQGDPVLAQASPPGFTDPKYFWGLLPERAPGGPPGRSAAQAGVPRADISPAVAYSQAPRVSLTRGLSLQAVRSLIALHARRRGGHLSVLELNLALDRLTARKKTTLAARTCLRGGCMRAQR